MAPSLSNASPPSSPISRKSPMAPISPRSSNEDIHVAGDKLTILHLGDSIQHNCQLWKEISSRHNVIRPPPKDLERATFLRHLKDGTWGNFSAIMRPFWATGNEMRPWDRELIESLPASMTVMASAGAGFDWVDVEALTERGITYCNGAHASTEAVADMALYFIIDVFRNMRWSSSAAHSNDAKEFQIAHRDVPSASHNPRGHTLGIIGLGNIGFAIAKKVKPALDMKIIYHDIFRKDDELERSVEAEYYSSLEEMLRACDCVLVATPSTGSPILNSTTLDMLPRGARVVNIARGSVIDDDALADVLESGHISGAALDVHRREPHVNYRLSRMRNVTMTCHTGGGSMETIQGFERLAMKNVDLMLGDKAPETAVNKVRRKDEGNVVNGTAKHGLEEDVEESGAKRQHVHFSHGEKEVA